MPGLGRSEDDDDVGRLGVGHPDLPSVEDVAAVVEPRDRLLVGGVGAGLLLGQREGADRLARREPAQPLSFCASLPNCAMGSATSELFTAAITATAALARATASIASA